MRGAKKGPGELATRCGPWGWERGLSLNKNRFQGCLKKKRKKKKMDFRFFVNYIIIVIIINPRADSQKYDILAYIGQGSNSNSNKNPTLQ